MGGGRAAAAPAHVNPGLCGDCIHARVVENRRGSRFYLCGLSVVDPAFPRYPPLPVLSCAGYDRAPDAADGAGGATNGPADRGTGG